MNLLAYLHVSPALAIYWKWMNRMRIETRVSVSTKRRKTENRENVKKIEQAQVAIRNSYKRKTNHLHAQKCKSQMCYCGTVWCHVTEKFNRKSAPSIHDSTIYNNDNNFHMFVCYFEMLCTIPLAPCSLLSPSHTHTLYFRSLQTHFIFGGAFSRLSLLPLLMQFLCHFHSFFVNLKWITTVIDLFIAQFILITCNRTRYHSTLYERLKLCRQKVK